VRRPGPAVALLLLLAMALSACGRGGPSGTDRASGIEGRVTIGPTCPVERPDSPCPDAPIVATIRVLSGSDVVATGRSASDGTFRIDVQPGTYTVAAEPTTAGGIARSTPVDGVVVRAGSFTHVDLSLDSGIR
jgi:hypothetical protein